MRTTFKKMWNCGCLSGVWAVLFGLAMTCCFIQPAARANSIYRVTLDTSPWVPGDRILAFTFIDGSGAGDANNTVTLSEFDFGGGNLTSSVIDPMGANFGGFSGNLSGAVTLVDNAFFTFFNQSFTLGNTLSFRVNMTTNVDPGGTPDAFSISLYTTASGNPADPTTAPDGSSFVIFDIDSAIPAPQVFMGDEITSGKQVTATVDIIPLPAAAWSGMALMGGLAASRLIRSVRRAA